MGIDLQHFINLSPGSVIGGRFEIIRCLGLGSMGFVYLCHDPLTDKPPLAMKVLSSIDSNGEYDETLLGRFRNEIRATSLIEHENVVRLFDCYEESDFVAYTMEYVRGGDLSSLIPSEPPECFDSALETLDQICSGVDAIHTADIIHRDLKPSNILLTERGEVKITDFGIAKMTDTPKFTAIGGVVGTVRYLSPGYLAEGVVSKAGDIYALGTIAYEMITGRAPFAGLSVIETVEAKINSVPIAPHEVNPACPKRLSRLIMKAIEVDPSKRFRSASDMREALRDLSRTQKGRSRKLTCRREWQALDLVKGERGAELVPAPLVARKGGLRPTRGSRKILIPLQLGLASFAFMLGSGVYKDATTPHTRRYVRQELKPVLTESSIEIPIETSLLEQFQGIVPERETEPAAELVVPGETTQPEPEESQSIIAIPEMVIYTAAPIGEQPELRQINVSMPISPAPRRAQKPKRVKPNAPKIPQGERLKPKPSPQERSTSVAALSPSRISYATQTEQQPVRASIRLDPPTEYKVRATLLYRFADYITWPERAFDGAHDSQRVCIIGEDPFGEHFDRHVANVHTKAGRDLAILRYPAKISTGQLRRCHIAYVGESHNGELAQLSQKLGDSSVVLITENTGLGTIDFVRRSRKVKFNINNRKATERGLEIDPLLLDLAVKVIW